MSSSEIGSPWSPQSLAKNALAGLTVSFVAISLGAAFGIASGRKDGAFIGILSAGVIALITSLFGGTRIQTSGPTAPMTAVSAAVVIAATTGAIAPQLAEMGIDTHLFINQVFLLTGALLLIMGIFRLGFLINKVPKVVISGFMNGIAILIWVAEVGKIFGIADQKQIGGQLIYNLVIVVVTTALCFFAAPLVKRFLPRFLHFLPGALIAILLVTTAVALLGLTSEDVEFIKLAAIHSVADLQRLFSNQMPTNWEFGVIILALPYAANLAFLCYLDTLLTALVVDKLATRMFGKKEETKRNKELVAQGLANTAVVFFGGIPGAQATIRSVLILKENATMRLAGVLVGVFVIVEMLIFQDWLQLIPKAVFTGVLFKVGWDVMDWGPIVGWYRKLRNADEPVLHTGHPQFAIIAGVTLVTIFVNLNVAVISFTVLFYVLMKTPWRVEDLFDGSTDDVEDEEPAEPPS